MGFVKPVMTVVNDCAKLLLCDDGVTEGTSPIDLCNLFPDFQGLTACVRVPVDVL